MTPPAFRLYQTENDYWGMREFLRQVFLRNQLLDRSWHVARLDYARYHCLMNMASFHWEDVVLLWEVENQIVAMVLPEGAMGEANFAIHPDFRTPELEEDMLCAAQERLPAVRPDGSHYMEVWTHEQDALRKEILEWHGYARGEWHEHSWHRDLSAPIPPIPPAPGFTIRSLGDGLELLERCYASGLGFHEGNIQIAVNNRQDPTWYRNIQTAPLYRRDLDLVAIAPDGAIAAFCTIWFDDVTRTAYYEPVATVPGYQRKGLGKALMTEGLHRLQRMGALRAFVSGYSEAAWALYQSVMGSACEVYERWVKTW